jgi:V/A-type H+-transporting ATPase subunit A
MASFYERAGMVDCLSSNANGRSGALSVIGAVSPPGGDLSDPVVQATLRVVKVFWSLEANLAYSRHFPAISWLNSYSLYNDSIQEKVEEEIAEDYFDLQAEAMRLLEKESELEEIVRLVGVDALSGPDRLVLLVSRMIREDFLHQNAFHEIDTYSSVEKQHKMIDVILHFYQQAADSLRLDADIRDIEAAGVKDAIARMKYIPQEELAKIDKIKKETEKEFSKLLEKPQVEE